MRDTESSVPFVAMVTVGGGPLQKGPVLVCVRVVSNPIERSASARAPDTLAEPSRAVAANGPNRKAPALEASALDASAIVSGARSSSAPIAATRCGSSAGATPEWSIRSHGAAESVRIEMGDLGLGNRSASGRGKSADQPRRCFPRAGELEISVKLGV